MQLRVFRRKRSKRRKKRGKRLLLTPEQGKINDRGVAAVAYNVLLRPGVTVGIGAAVDTQKLDQATHKVFTLTHAA